MQKQAPRSRPRFFYGYWIILVGFFCQFIAHGCGTYSFSLYVVPLQTEFGWSRAAIMIGNMMWSLILGFASPFVGRVIYKWGAKRVIAAGALIMGAGFALLGMAHSLSQFYLAYAVVGLGAAAAGVVPTSMVLANWFKKRRGFAIGMLGAGIGVGGFVMPWLLSNYVMPNFGWRGGYFFSGIISAAILIPLSLWLVKERPEDMGLLQDNGEVGEAKQRRTAYGPEPGLKFNQARKTPAFWLMVIAFAAFGFGGGIPFQNQVPHLEDVGFPAVQAAIAMQATGIGSAIGKLGFGWLCDYIRPKYALIIGSAIQVGAVLILMSITSLSPVALFWVYGILLGLGIGSWLPAFSMNTNFMFGLIDYGVIFGIYNFLFMAANSTSPVLGGHIFDTTGSYHLAFLLSVIFLGVAILAMFLVRRPKTSKESFSRL